MLVLAEKGLILLTVGVAYLSSFPRSATCVGGLGGSGPWWGRLTPTGQWQVHSIPRDTMTSILRGGSGSAGAARRRVGGRLQDVPFISAVRSPSPLPSPLPRGFAPLVVLLYIAFLLLFLLILIIKLFLSQPTSVTLLILSPIYRWGSERATVWG